MQLADHQNPRSLASRMRRRRLEMIVELAADFRPPVRVLDVGGTESFWLSAGDALYSNLAITLLNLEAVEVSDPKMTSVAGDGRDMSEIDTDAFDIVFSNSVIEHVGGHAERVRMANEIRRTGRSYFVQTPSRFFPLEPHFHVPMFQFFPLRVRAELLHRYDLGWQQKEPDYDRALQAVTGVDLLGRRQLQALFPDAELETERFLGLEKSLIAVKRLS